MGKIGLGDYVKCKITGFEGTVTGVHNYITGCTRISVQPPLDKDGKMQADYTFDEPLLELLQKEKIKTGEELRKTGGPALWEDRGKTNGKRV